MLATVLADVLTTLDNEDEDEEDDDTTGRMTMTAALHCLEQYESDAVEKLVLIKIVNTESGL